MKKYFDFEGYKKYLEEQGVEIEGLMCNAYKLNRSGHFILMLKEPDIIKSLACGGTYDPEIEKYWREDV